MTNVTEFHCHMMMNLISHMKEIESVLRCSMAQQKITTWPI